jgi:hypothetical protein
MESRETNTRLAVEVRLKNKITTTLLRRDAKIFGHETIIIKIIIIIIILLD